MVKQNRIRRRPVTFGNPALGTYEGVVFTLEGGFRSDSGDSDSAQDGHDSYAPDITLMLPSCERNTELSMDCVAAMVQVPPEQVPEGILHLARAHRSYIHHVRILISMDSDEDGPSPATTHATANDTRNNMVGNVSVTAPALVGLETPSSTPTATPTTTPHAAAWNKSSSLSPSSYHQRRHHERSMSSSSSVMDDVVLPSPSASAAQTAAAIFASDPSPQISNKVEYTRASGSTSGSDIWMERNTKNNKSLHKQVQQRPSQSSATAERTYLILFVLSSPQAARHFVHDLNKKPYTTLDETQVAHVMHVVAFEGSNGVSLLSPGFCATNQGTESQHNEESGGRGISSVSPSFYTNNSTIATAMSLAASRPNHNDALEGIQTKNNTEEEVPEVHNCAVCLEPLDQADDPGILTTVCNHSFHWACLWHCKDSPCPVCRYDHASLNEALSQCHVCGTTEHNYVCLICGVISCATLASASVGHAREHYDQTLHAYALDTGTQHVWDFCGQGYVHRLLQNTSDGKLVEVSNQSYNQRRPEAGHLSDTQEDEVVHRKLEGFANQYYTLLKSQLEQQRIYYEGRLEELLRNKERQLRTNSSERLIAALKQERRQLHHRLSTLQDRYHKVADEVSFLKNLNESLATNKDQMKHQVHEAQRERNEARDMIQMALPPLELKVHRLILQLEEEDTKPAAK